MQASPVLIGILLGITTFLVIGVFALAFVEQRQQKRERERERLRAERRAIEHLQLYNADFLRLTQAHEGRYAEQMERWRAASKKAEALLETHLSPEQQASLAKDGSFIVRGKVNRYRISQNGVIWERRVLDDVYLCTVPYQTLPVGDDMLAKKIMIEADEELFLRNCYPNSSPAQRLTVDGQLTTAPPNRYADGFGQPRFVLQVNELQRRFNEEQTDRLVINGAVFLRENDRVTMTTLNGNAVLGAEDTVTFTGGY